MVASSSALRFAATASSENSGSSSNLRFREKAELVGGAALALEGPARRLPPRARDRGARAPLPLAEVVVGALPESGSAATGAKASASRDLAVESDDAVSYTHLTLPTSDLV